MIESGENLQYCSSEKNINSKSHNINQDLSPIGSIKRKVQKLEDVNNAELNIDKRRKSSDKDMNSLFDIEILIETNNLLNKKVNEMAFENNNLSRDLESLKKFYLIRNSNSPNSISDINYQELLQKIKHQEDEINLITKERNEYKRKMEKVAEKNIHLIKTIDEYSKRLYTKERNSQNNGFQNNFISPSIDFIKVLKKKTKNSKLPIKISINLLYWKK